MTLALKETQSKVLRGQRGSARGESGVFFPAPAFWALGPSSLTTGVCRRPLGLPVPSSSLLHQTEWSGGVLEPQAGEFPTWLHGRGRPVGAGAVELGLRLGAAARRARYFLIWQLPPPHQPSPDPDRSDQPWQGHRLPSQQIRKRVEGLAALSHGLPPGGVSLYPTCSPG